MAGRPRMKYRRVSDAFDELRSAGGILITAAPDEYISGEFKGDTPLSNAWSNSVDAMMFACSEFESGSRYWPRKQVCRRQSHTSPGPTISPLLAIRMQTLSEGFAAFGLVAEECASDGEKIRGTGPEYRL